MSPRLAEGGATLAPTDLDNMQQAAMMLDGLVSTAKAASTQSMPLTPPSATDIRGSALFPQLGSAAASSSACSSVLSATILSFSGLPAISTNDRAGVSTHATIMHYLPPPSYLCTAQDSLARIAPRMHAYALASAISVAAIP